MAINFRPMLAVNAKKDKIKYPCLYSTKVDGVRCIFKNGEMLARSLKPITSKTLNEKYQLLKDLTKATNIILDGEMYAHDMEFNEISRYVRKSDLEIPENLKFHCFDLITDENYEEEFTSRFKKLCVFKNKDVVIVKQNELKSSDGLDTAFKDVLEKGYEGLILRSKDSPYKCGRSSVTEGYLLKIKPFISLDNKICGVIERMENLNESFKNELGRSTKRNTKNDKKGTGIAAVFEIEYYDENGVRVKVDGKDPRVTITGDEAFRREIWEHKENYIGKMIEYKCMVYGSKNFPRHSNFLRFREDRD